MIYLNVVTRFVNWITGGFLNDLFEVFDFLKILSGDAYEILFKGFDFSSLIPACIVAMIGIAIKRAII